MRKLISLFAVMILMLSVLSGCGGKTPDPKSELPATTTENAPTDPDTDTTEDTGEATGEATGDATDQTDASGNTDATKSGATAANTKAATTTTKTNTPVTTNSAGGWTPPRNYTAEELDQVYPLRKNISGEVKIYSPFMDEPVTQKAIARFKKAYPNATITEIRTNNVSRDEKLASLVRSGAAPDYVFTTYQDYPLRAYQGLTMAIDQYIQPRIGQSDVLMDITSYKGKKYAVIEDSPCAVLWYNTALFQSKGEKTPKQYWQENNWTWATLKTVAKKMTNLSNGVYGFATEDEYFFPLSAGQDIVKIVNGKAQLNLVNNKTYLDAHQFFIDMINVDKSTYPEHWSALEQFKTGKIAMLFGSYAWDRYFDEAGLKTYDYAPFPKQTKSSQYYSLVAGVNGGFSIATGAKNIEGGMAFGEMMFNAQVQDLGGNMTKYKGVYEMSKQANIQYVVTRSVGYGLYEKYMQGICGWARTNTKDLSQLINENAQDMTNIINNYQDK